MSKSIVKTYNPVSRVVKEGGVLVDAHLYKDDALLPFEGKEVLMDPVIDVQENCFSGFEVWSAEGQKLCVLELADRSRV